MTQTNPIVQAKNLCKRFGAIRALQEVSTDIPAGSIIGLIGDNGAGKSTLLRHIIGLYLPDSGTCTTFGCDAARLGPPELSRIGYVHQEGKLPEWMNVGQLIRYVRAYYPGWNADLERTYIADFQIGLDDRVGTLSPGQRQKLAILLAIAFEPDLLILDEPASALDPLARSRFLKLLLDIIRNEGRTIIISSHILSDIEKIVDHVMIMRAGRILCDCSFDALRESFLQVTLTALRAPLPETLPFVNVLRTDRTERQARLTLRDVDPNALKAAAAEMDCDIECQPLTLEELYEHVVTSA